MKLKAAILTIAAFLLALNTIGCADGGSRKSRINASPAAGKIADPNKDGQNTDAPDKTATDGNPENAQPTQPSETAVDTFDSKISGSIQDDLEEVIQGSIITKESLANKTLVLEKITLKYSTVAAKQDESSYSAIASYEADKDNTFQTSSEIKARATGNSKGLLTYSLPAPTQVVFGEKARIDSSQNTSSYVLNVELSDKSLSLNGDEAKVVEERKMDHLLDILSSSQSDSKGLISFTTQGLGGSLRLLSEGDKVKMIVELNIDESTIQVFALTYAVKKDVASEKAE